ncbi:hypothetical protein [Dysgonomonas massiliensis]|uniref:hypothetical protein n=1 Tax=Dysgonomonas massiliensis TaxID=2040292 RepID=UPI000C76E270|nr:hypothetical protein [Dysgonomonas massiliensis]
MHKQFKTIYWINLLIFIIGFLGLLQVKGPDFGTNIESDIAFERYAIIITLASIPLALKLFHNMMSKTKNLDAYATETIYKKAYFIRLGILDLAAIINIIGFHLFEATNFIYMTIVVLAAMLFCYPSSNIQKTEEEEL